MIKLFKSFKILDWILILGIFIFVLCQTFLEMEFIGCTEELLNLVKSNTKESSAFWTTGLKMMGIALIIVISIIIVNIITSLFSSRIARDLRRRVFIKVNSFSSTEINKFNTSSLITRSTNDVTQVQRTLTANLRLLFVAPCMAFFAIRKITLNSMELSGIALSFLIGTLSVLITLLIFVLPRFSRLQKQTDKLNLVTRENLSGIRVVRAYNGEDYQEGKFSKANEELTKTNLFLNRTMSLLNPALHLVMSMMTLTIYWIGSSLINNDKLTYPVMMTFGQYSMHVIMSFMFITLMFVTIPRGLVSLRRINEILDEEVVLKMVQLLNHLI